MKKTKLEKRFARILAVLLSAVMLFGTSPFAYAETAGSTTVTSLDSFNNPGGSVDDYSVDGVNPYGYGDGQVFTMSAQSELYHLYSYNLNRGDGDYRNHYFYHNFQPGTIKDGIASAKMSGITPEEGVAPYAQKGAITPRPGEDYILYHMQAVAFDPFNSGRDDHIAFIGIDKDGNIRVYVMDANTGKVSNLFRVGLEGAAQHLVGNKMQAYEASNYIAITAGRYVAYDESKPQQGETLVVYAPDYKSVPSLRELSVSLSGGNLVVSQIGSGSSYLQYDYRVGTYGKRMQEEGDVNDSLAVSLATGDFDGDRIDDLAVLSGVSDVDGAYQTVSYQYFMPELYMVFGGGSGTILNRSAVQKEIGIWNDDKTEMRTFTSPGLTAGDLDGDGVDDIIAAGWQLVVKKDSNKASINGYQLAEGVTVAAYSGLRKTATQMILTHFDETDDSGKSGNIVNHWSSWMQAGGITKANFLVQVFVMPKYVVEAVAINGGSAADMIFMNGTFCKFDTSEGLAYVHTPSYFRYADSAVEGTDVNTCYISSAAVAVFDDNTVGREQITVSVGLKEKGQDDYWFLMGTMGGYEYDDRMEGGEVKQYGYTEKIYSTAFDRKAFDTSEYDYNHKDDYPVQNKGNGEGQFLNHLVVAVDIGQDGILARYSTKELVYSDPNLVAVLQAAPYFGELSGTEGSTAYEVGVEYTIGEQSSQSTSFSIGISAEVEGPGVKTSFGAGYNASWSKSFEESVTESYSTTFEAGEENVVVLQRTPIVVYCYEVLNNSTGKWTGKMQVSIPAGPIYILLPVDEYNAFADDFNAKLKASDKNYTGNRLNKIEAGLENADSLLGNEGNPDLYIKSWTGIVGATSLSSSTYGVTTATGSITSSYSSSTSETEGSEQSQGFYVNASIGTGASFLVGSAYVGVETSVEGDWTVGSYTTTTSYTAVSGSVSNLGNVEENIPSNILSQYGFSWTFGTWDIKLDKDNPKIPVYGFQVSGVTRPTNSPQNPKAEHGSSETEVILSWDAVAGASGYIIYSYDISGARSEIGRIAPASGTPATTFTYTIDNSVPFYTFAISAITGTDTEGAMSTKVFYYPQNTGLGGQDGITPQLRINPDTNEWEVSYDGGLTWISLGVKATGENGTDGQDGTDGSDGTDGQDGTDGITPQLRINPDTNMWEISYDEGVTWISLGVEAVNRADLQAVADALNDAVAALNTAIDLKADATALAQAIADLTAAYEAADAVLQSNISAEIDADVAALQVIVEAADTALQAAIDTVQDNLDNAVATLNAAIDQKADATALAQAIADLTAAYEAADAVLQSNISAEIDADVAALQAIVEAADTALQAAIDTVQDNLDNAVALLEQAIADGNTDLETKLTALEEAYQAADALLRTDIASLKAASTSLSANISALRNTLNSVETELAATIETVQTNLDQAIADLEAAIAAGDSDLDLRLSALEKAYQAADALLSADIEALRSEDAAIKTSIAGLEASLADLTAKLEAAIQALREEVEQKLNANTAQLQQALAELEAAMAETDSQLKAQLEAQAQAQQDANAQLHEEKADAVTTYVLISVLGLMALSGNAGWIILLRRKIGK